MWTKENVDFLKAMNPLEQSTRPGIDNDDSGHCFFSTSASGSSLDSFGGSSLHTIYTSSLSSASSEVQQYNDQSATSLLLPSLPSSMDASPNAIGSSGLSDIFDDFIKEQERHQQELRLLQQQVRERGLCHFGKACENKPREEDLLSPASSTVDGEHNTVSQDPLVWHVPANTGSTSAVMPIAEEVCRGPSHQKGRESCPGCTTPATDMNRRQDHPLSPLGLEFLNGGRQHVLNTNRSCGNQVARMHRLGFKGHSRNHLNTLENKTVSIRRRIGTSAMSARQTLSCSDSAPTIRKDRTITSRTRSEGVSQIPTLSDSLIKVGSETQREYSCLPNMSQSPAAVAHSILSVSEPYRVTGDVKEDRRLRDQHSIFCSPKTQKQVLIMNVL